MSREISSSSDSFELEVSSGLPLFTVCELSVRSLRRVAPNVVELRACPYYEARQSSELARNEGLRDPAPSCKRTASLPRPLFHSRQLKAQGARVATLAPWRQSAPSRWLERSRLQASQERDAEAGPFDSLGSPLGASMRRCFAGTAPMPSSLPVVRCESLCARAA